MRNVVEDSSDVCEFWLEKNINGDIVLYSQINDYDTTEFRINPDCTWIKICQGNLKDKEEDLE